MKFNILILSVFLIFLTKLNAQQAKIKLMDEATKQPLEFAYYTYGDQSGISDEAGHIFLKYTDRQKLRINHISYGNKVFSQEAVQEAISTGVLFVERYAGYDLQPVTIIAIQHAAATTEEIRLGYHHQLSHDAGQLLQQSAAVSGIRKSGSYGFDPVIRGFKYDQLNIVIDGHQTATAACPNRMDPPTSQISPNMTERIEIIKGPHSLRFGNAFGGTVNFIDAQAEFTDKTNAYGRVTTAYESNGNIFSTGALAGLSSQFANIRLFGSWSQGADYFDGESNKIPAKFNRGSMGAKLALKPDKNHLIELSVSNNRSKDVDFPSLPMDLRSDDAILASLKHRLELGNSQLKSWETGIYGSWVDHFMDNRLKELDPRMLFAETNARTKNLGARTEAELRSSSTKTFIGADLKVEEAEGTRVREFIMGPNAGKVFYDNAWQNGRISRSAVFAEHKRLYSSFSVIASARFELNQAEALDASPEFLAINNSLSITQVNPSLSFGFTYYFNQSVTASVSAGRAQRSAGLAERYINFFPVGLDPYELIGNPKLKPEINNQADFQLMHSKGKSKWSAGFFIAYLQDYISAVVDTTVKPRLPASPGVRKFVNLERALLSGFELEFLQELPGQLTAGIAAAYTHGKDLASVSPLPEIPPLDIRFSLAGSYLSNRLQPEIQLRHVSRQDRVSADFGEIETPGFVLLDFGLAWRASKRIVLNAGIKNLLDEAYYEHLSRSNLITPGRPLYAPGRSFYTRLHINLM